MLVSRVFCARIGLERIEEKEGKNGRPIVKAVPIEYVFPAGMSTFANNATVQNDGHDMYLSFFEMTPPHLIGTEEQRREQMAGIESIKATCVARVAMSTDRIPGLIRALQDQLEKANTNRKRLLEDEVNQDG